MKNKNLVIIAFFLIACSGGGVTETATLDPSNTEAVENFIAQGIQVDDVEAVLVGSWTATEVASEVAFQASASESATTYEVTFDESGQISDPNFLALLGHDIATYDETAPIYSSLTWAENFYDINQAESCDATPPYPWCDTELVTNAVTGENIVDGLINPITSYSVDVSDEFPQLNVVVSGETLRLCCVDNLACSWGDVEYTDDTGVNVLIMMPGTINEETWPDIGPNTCVDYDTDGTDRENSESLDLVAMDENNFVLTVGESQIIFTRE